MKQAWGQTLTADDRRWIDVRWNWLTEQFGSSFHREIVLTEPEYFPDGYHYDEESVRSYLLRVCTYMDVNPEQIRLHFYDERSDEVVRDRPQTTAGLYIESIDHFQIWIESKQIADPLALVATLAHELAHVRLLGEKRISPENLDHELLTDLLTIYLGLGVFTSNSVIREDYWQEGNHSGWRMSRQGYLPMPMLGYALALFATSRGEANPTWLKYIRTDIRSHFNQSMKLIQTIEDPWLKHRVSDEEFLSRYAKKLPSVLPALQADTDDPETAESERGQPTCYYCGTEVGEDREVCTDCQESIDTNAEELTQERIDYEYARRHQKHFVWILFTGLLGMVCWIVYESLTRGK